MKRKLSFMLVTVFFASGMSIPAISANDGIDSHDLWNHSSSVDVNTNVTMYECWDVAIESSPRLLQEVGKRWITLDTSTVSRDSKKCGKKKPMKAVFTFKVRDSLRWNAKAETYEAVVKTVCSNCETYDWTIFVIK